MSSSSVWVQLYYKGKDEPNGQPIKIKPAPEDVAELIKEVKKEELKKELDHAGLTEISVFSSDTTPPFLQDKAINTGDDVPSDTTSRNPLIVVAPDTPQQPKKPIVVTLKYSRNRIDIHPWLEQLTLQSLREAVMTAWSEFEVAEFRLTADGAILLKDESDLAKLTFPATIEVKNMRKGFSDFKEAEAYSYARIVNHVFDEKQFPPFFDIQMDSEVFQHAKKDLTIKHKIFGALTEGCEYTRREFISSVLLLAANIAKVNLGVEELVAGRLGHGPVDWVALYKSYRICITEGKKDDLTKGIVQNIAQMVATGEDRNPKRKFSPDIPTYGIATTYTEWVFLKLTCGETRALFRWNDRTIDKDNIEVGLKQVAGQIVAIFKEQKATVDKAICSSPAKRVFLGQVQKGLNG